MEPNTEACVFIYPKRRTIAEYAEWENSASYVSVKLHWQDEDCYVFIWDFDEDGDGRGRSCQCAHAHSVGNTIENGQLCRAVQKTGWTRPLGTTAGVPEDWPGDCGTRRRLRGVNSDSFPGDNLLPKPRRKQRVQGLDESAPSPISLPRPLLSAPQERQRDISDVAAKCVGFIPAAHFSVSPVNKTERRQ